jgi:hypothetical protein
MAVVATSAAPSAPISISLMAFPLLGRGNARARRKVHHARMSGI